MARLNRKQKRFVDEYLIDLNATKAAIRAGYSEASAHVEGSKLLNIGRIKSLVEKEIHARLLRTQSSQDKVIKELERLAFSDMANVATWNDFTVKFKDSLAMSPDVTASIIEVSSSDKMGMKVKLHDKVRALELLGNHLGMFKEKKPEVGSDKPMKTVVLKYAVDEDPKEEMPA